MTDTTQSLADRLKAADIPLATVEPGEVEAPWFVKTLLALSGWLASLFILGFFGLAFESLFRDAAGAWILGAMVLGGAYGLFRVAKNDFLDHLGLSLSLTGQLLIAWAIAETWRFDWDSPFWAMLAVVQLGLALVMPNVIHRVVTMGFAAMAYAVSVFISGWLMAPAGLPLLVLVVLWLNEFRVPSRVRTVQSLGYGLALGVVVINLVSRYGWADNLWPDLDPHTPVWLGDVITLVALLVLVVGLFRRMSAEVSIETAGLALFSALAMGALSLEVTGLGPGVVLLVLGFAVSNRLLMGLGIAAALVAVSTYYYRLDITLLSKSGLLCAMGLGLLAIRWALLRWWRREDDHA